MSQIKHILHKFQAKDYLQVGRYAVNAMVCSRLSHLHLLLMYSPYDAQCTQTLTHKHIHCTQNYNNIIIITMFYTQAPSEHDINLARSGWYLFFAVQLIPPHNIINRSRLE